MVKPNIQAHDSGVCALSKVLHMTPNFIRLSSSDK